MQDGQHYHGWAQLPSALDAWSIYGVSPDAAVADSGQDRVLTDVKRRMCDGHPLIGMSRMR
jgi:hypothetical protein